MKYIVIAVLAITVLVLIYVGVIFGLPPSVEMPVPGTYLSEGMRVTCGSAACYYFRGYKTSIKKEDVVRAFTEKNWNCMEIQEENTFNLFGLKAPYWECSGSAFPQGDATVAIKEEEPPSTDVIVYMHVLWKA